ncbi:virulence factor TspB C-terminal domain-related protein [Halomonas elongata]|uniref:virulence factor TspB C-terminal domain-related protein n=1 Tax=Halomonas elongata TaxID=2746 RepID=UPI0040339E00
MAPTGGEETIAPSEDPHFPAGVGQWNGWGIYTDTLSEAVSHYEEHFDRTLEYYKWLYPANDKMLYKAVYKCYYISSVSGNRKSCDTVSFSYHQKDGEEIPENHKDYSPNTKLSPAPASPGDISKIDEYLPNSIVDDIWEDQGGTYPENWNDPDIQSDGNAAPEIQEAVSKWAENLGAKLEGQAAPHPDAATSGNTAPEQQLENQEAAQDAWEDPPPESAYPAMPTPSWNVKVIDDLPDYNASLGAGQCPEPDVIPVPGYGDITLDWQPACDLASGIRGAVIGICFIAALYIALGQSRSSES